MAMKEKPRALRAFHAHLYEDQLAELERRAKAAGGSAAGVLRVLLDRALREKEPVIR